MCVFSDEMFNIPCLNSFQNKETWIWKNTYQFGSDHKLPVNIKTLATNNRSDWIMYLSVGSHTWWGTHYCMCIHYYGSRIGVVLVDFSLLFINLSQSSFVGQVSFIQTQCTSN
jgi:hypothetical protein